MEQDDVLYKLVATAMFNFIKTHLVSFPNALASKVDFWTNKEYKRAMVFVFMVRFVFKMAGQKQWKKFSQADYKFNVRLFNKWILVDEDVMSYSKGYQNLPTTATPRKRKRIGRGRRKQNAKEGPASSTDEAVVLNTCVVEDDFTDDSLTVEFAKSEGEETEAKKSEGEQSGEQTDEEDSSDDA